MNNKTVIFFFLKPGKGKIGGKWENPTKILKSDQNPSKPDSMNLKYETVSKHFPFIGNNNKKGKTPHQNLINC